MKTKESLEIFKKRGILLIKDDIGGLDRSVLVSPASEIDYSTVNLFSSFTGGLIYVSFKEERRKLFQIDLMTDRSALSPNTELGMCVSVEAREGVTTGISVADRLVTIKVLAEETPSPRKLVKPGHIFPIVVRDGGSLVKPGLPEAAYDVVRLFSNTEVAAFVDLLNDEGEFLSSNEADVFARNHDLPVILISELIRYRLENEILVQQVAEATLPSKAAGNVIARAYIDKISGAEHVALISGELNFDEAITIRVQRENLIEDLFGGQNSSRFNLQKSLGYMSQLGAGVFVYISKHENLHNITSPALTENFNSQTKLMREYGIGAQILRDIGIKKAKLLTQTKKNLTGLKSFGIEIVSQEPIPAIKNTTDIGKSPLGAA